MDSLTSAHPPQHDGGVVHEVERLLAALARGEVDLTYRELAGVIVDLVRQREETHFLNEGLGE